MAPTITQHPREPLRAPRSLKNTICPSTARLTPETAGEELFQQPKATSLPFSPAPCPPLMVLAQPQLQRGGGHSTPSPGPLPPSRLQPGPWAGSTCLEQPSWARSHQHGGKQRGSTQSLQDCRRENLPECPAVGQGAWHAGAAGGHCYKYERSRQANTGEVAKIKYIYPSQQSGCGSLARQQASPTSGTGTGAHQHCAAPAPAQQQPGLWAATEALPWPPSKQSQHRWGALEGCDLPCAAGTKHVGTTAPGMWLLQPPSLQHRARDYFWGAEVTCTQALKSHSSLLVLLLLYFQVSQQGSYLYRGSCPPHAVSQMHFGGCSQPRAFPALLSPPAPALRGTGLPAPAGRRAEGLTHTEPSQ